MPARRVLLLSALAGALVLSACQSAPPRSAPRPIDFSSFGPIVLDVGAIDVVDAYRSSGQPPHVEQSAPVTPAQAVRLWASQRLQATGGPGRVRVVIKDASITETQLPRTQGVKGLFTTDQAQRYDGRLEVEVTGERTGETTFRGFTKAIATQSTTVPENISLADREATLLDLTRRMAEDINVRLDAGIRRDLTPLVRR